jgi:hypothetical protein
MHISTEFDKAAAVESTARLPHLDPLARPSRDSLLSSRSNSWWAEEVSNLTANAANKLLFSMLLPELAYYGRFEKRESYKLADYAYLMLTWGLSASAHLVLVTCP